MAQTEHGEPQAPEDAASIGAKLAAMADANEAAAEAETPEDEDEEGAEEETHHEPNPLQDALVEYIGKVEAIIGNEIQIRPCAYCQGKGFNPVELLPDPKSKPCEACGGFGEVITGSKVPGNEARQCQDCHGGGYIAEATPIVLPGGKTDDAPLQVLSEAELAEVVRKAQEQAGANAA